MEERSACVVVYLFGNPQFVASVGWPQPLEERVCI